MIILFYFESANFSLWFQLLEQQGRIQSSWRRNWVWPIGDKVTDLLELILLQDPSRYEDWPTAQVHRHPQAGWLSVLNYRWWAIPKHVTGTWHMMEVLDWSKRPPRRFTVTERGSIFTHWQLIGSLRLPKQGSVLSPTMQITALMLIPELDLVQEDHMMTTTRVESLQMKAVLIMGRSSLKPWGTSWCSDERKLYI